MSAPSSKPQKRRKPRQSEPRLSKATENYLVSIMELEEQGLRVTATQISDELRRMPIGEGLGTSLPSVGGMLRRMIREKLVETAANKDILLTAKGRASAESIVRRHRLAERMVVDLLGLELHEAHVEAHRLEHAISPKLEEKIIARLGNPTTCPFGHPMPGSGYVAPSNTVRLDSVAPGRQVVVDRIPEDDQALLQYLVANSVIPGQAVTVNEAAPYRGVIKLVCGGNDVVLGYEVASRIWVLPRPDAELG